MNPGQAFPIVTNFGLTCAESKFFIDVRVDVVEVVPKAVLSSSSVRIGYLIHGGTVNASAVNNLTAPPMQGPWTIKIVAIAWVSTPTNLLSQRNTDPLTISVGGVPQPERVETVSMLQNGGFEQGLKGWNVELDSGFVATSRKFAFNGSSSSLQLEMPPAPRPAGRIFGAWISGVTQGFSIENLRSLRFSAWVLDGCFAPDFISCPLLGSGRVRVQVGGFYQIYELPDCSSWCLIDQNVTEDLRQRLTLTQFDSVFESNQPISVVTSLELLNDGAYFVAYLDNVLVNATVQVKTIPGSASISLQPPDSASPNDQGYIVADGRASPLRVQSELIGSCSRIRCEKQIVRGSV